VHSARLDVLSVRGDDVLEQMMRVLVIMTDQSLLDIIKSY